jgi:hypothetical protein
LKESQFAFKSKSQSKNKLVSGERDKTFAKFKREVDTDAFLPVYPTGLTRTTATATATHPDARFVKTWKSTRKKFPGSNSATPNKDNGARRGDSPEVRVGHQDLSDGRIDFSAPSVQPWPKDPRCSRFRTHFAKRKTFKPRALVSFPGSGNSWLRYLIEGSTGFFTGSVFNDSKIFASGLLGELCSPIDGSTIVQKTHHDALRLSSLQSRKAYVKLTELMFGYRGILLIRNPYDALISYWNFVETRDHRGLAAGGNKFNADKWEDFVLALAPKWSSMITTWVENSQSLLIIQYEQLKKNPHSELIRILDYLELPVNEERLACVLGDKNIEGPFHRRHNKDTNQNSSFFSSTSTGLNNPFRQELLLGGRNTTVTDKTRESETETYELQQNPKSWNDEHNSVLSSSVGLIVQNNINNINRFFRDKNIPIFLDYKGPTQRQK